MLENLGSRCGRDRVGTDRCSVSRRSLMASRPAFVPATGWPSRAWLKSPPNTTSPGWDRSSGAISANAALVQLAGSPSRPFQYRWLPARFQGRTVLTNSTPPSWLAVVRACGATTAEPGSLVQTADQSLPGPISGLDVTSVPAPRSRSCGTSVSSRTSQSRR